MNKSTIFYISLLILSALFNGCVKQPLPAPIVLDGISQEMRSPGYWISKAKNPDKVILNSKEIEKLNSDFEEVKLNNNLNKFGSSYYAGQNFGNAVKKSFVKYNKYASKNLSKSAIKKTLNTISANINFSALNSPVQVQYAAAAKSADLRILPTSIPFYSSQETEGLDRLQVTRLHLGEPLIVSYKTKDEKWFYVFSREAEGWIQSSALAFCEKEQWSQIVKINNANSKEAANFVIVISVIADIYADDEKTDFIDYAQMGSRFIVEEIKDSLVRIKVPSADENGKMYFREAFIDKSDISNGYLKYNRRNILTQSFKYLNTSYGWGGQDDFVDCSSFIKNVFVCFGINLPRNSASQIRSTTEMKNIAFQKDDTQKSKNIKIRGTALAGFSLLYFPGHIMLYIGQENAEPYIIHSIWGYRDKNDKKLYLINKVTVSDMSLGKNSKKGSLLERTAYMKTLAK